jgi:hypothetical protein
MPHCHSINSGMPLVELWRWRVQGEPTGPLYVTRKYLTEAGALAIDPLAVRVEWLTVLQWVRAQ